MSTGEPPPNTSVGQTARLLQRSGLILLGTGFLVAVAAAAVIGQRVSHLETAATAVHKVGLFVLLAGFCLLLSSYRVRQLLDWLQRRGLTDERTRLSDYLADGLLQRRRSGVCWRDRRHDCDVRGAAAAPARALGSRWDWRS